jgi:hypothetical protein
MVPFRSVLPAGLPSDGAPGEARRDFLENSVNYGPASDGRKGVGECVLTRRQTGLDPQVKVENRALQTTSR